MRIGITLLPAKCQLYINNLVSSEGFFPALIEPQNFDFGIFGATGNSLLKENFRTHIVQDADSTPGRNRPTDILP